MADPLESLPDQLRDALQRGRLVDAIKLLRQAKGGSLRDARDALASQPRAQAGMQAAPFAAADPLPPDVIAALQRGERIDAIRLLRKHRGIDLKTAKLAVDEYATRVGSTSHGLSPGEVPRSSSTFWLVVVVGLVAFLAYYLIARSD